MEFAFNTRRTVRLSGRRVSIAGARYFITLCVADRAEQIAETPVSSQLINQLEQQEGEADFELQCSVVMPDHIHFVIRLGDRISLSQSIAKFKVKTKRFVSWQENFYEHRIRPDENEENYAFYVFMNPYVENLCGPSERWRGWKCWRKVPYDFEDLLGSGGQIPVEWVKKEKTLRGSLSV